MQYKRPKLKEVKNYAEIIKDAHDRKQVDDDVFKKYYKPNTSTRANFR